MVMGMGARIRLSCYERGKGKQTDPVVVERIRAVFRAAQASGEPLALSAIARRFKVSLSTVRRVLGARAAAGVV